MMMRSLLLTSIFACNILLFSGLVTSAQDALRHRHLDSLDEVLKSRMEQIDSTVVELDRRMDSLTGKRPLKYDTMALYRHLIEKNRLEQRQKERTYLKLGFSALAAILVLAFWNWYRKRKKGRDY